MEPTPRVPSSPWLCREPRVRTPRGGQVLCPHIPQDWFWGGVWAGCRGASRSSQAVAGAAGAWAVGAEPASGGDGGGPLSAERGAAWDAAHGTVGESGSTGRVTSPGLGRTLRTARCCGARWARQESAGSGRVRMDGRHPQGLWAGAWLLLHAAQASAVCVPHMSSVRDPGAVGTRGHARLTPCSRADPSPCLGRAGVFAQSPACLALEDSCAAVGPAGVLGRWVRSWACSLLLLMRPQGPQALAGCSRGHPPTGRLWGTVETGEQVRPVPAGRTGLLGPQSRRGASTFLPSLASAQGASGPRRSPHAGWEPRRQVPGADTGVRGRLCATHDRVCPRSVRRRPGAMAPLTVSDAVASVGRTSRSVV